jgi:hypothetical protein
MRWNPLENGEKTHKSFFHFNKRIDGFRKTTLLYTVENRNLYPESTSLIPQRATANLRKQINAEEFGQAQQT